MNVGVFTAFGIRQQTFDKCKGIYVGGLITKILKGLQLWPALEPRDLFVEATTLPQAPFTHWGINQVTNTNLDIEDLNTTMNPLITSKFSVDNLHRLEKEVAEVKGNVQLIIENQEELKSQQQGLLAFMKKSAEKIGARVPSCFSCPSTHEEGEPS